MPASRDQTALFVIQAHPYDFQTGRTADQRQVIMGLLCPSLVAYFFSTAGDLLEREVRAWEFPAPRMKDNGPFRIYDDEFRRRLAVQLAGWQGEMGFEPQAVSLKLFFDEEQTVGIRELPEHLKDFARCEDDEELAEAQAGLKEWKEQGNFVFWWAKDYFMAADGTVMSS